MLGRIHEWSYELPKGRVLGCVAKGKRHNVRTRPVCVVGKTKKSALRKARKKARKLFRRG